MSKNDKSIKELLAIGFEREKRLQEWNKNNRHRVWEITNIKFDNEPHAVDNEFRGNAYLSDQRLAPHTPNNGQIIYTPHKCHKPNPRTTPIGSIWECHEQTQKSPDGAFRMCYDQWILEGNSTYATWVLFERSF